MWVINQLHDLTGEDWLLPLAAKSREQGFDWFGYADDLPFKEKVPQATLLGYQAAHGGDWMNDEYLSSHVVNVAMGLKAMPVWWRHDPSAGHQERLGRMIDGLDEHHGQASGLFSGDEHLAGRHPSQGSETCAVVEYLASLEVALETWGPVDAVADRLKRLAFNALPASTSYDEWAHQYDQQANQVSPGRSTRRPRGTTRSTCTRPASPGTRSARIPSLRPQLQFGSTSVGAASPGRWNTAPPRHLRQVKRPTRLR